MQGANLSRAALPNSTVRWVVGETAVVIPLFDGIHHHFAPRVFSADFRLVPSRTYDGCSVQPLLWLHFFLATTIPSLARSAQSSDFSPPSLPYNVCLVQPLWSPLLSFACVGCPPFRPPHVQRRVRPNLAVRWLLLAIFRDHMSAAWDLCGHAPSRLPRVVRRISPCWCQPCLIIDAHHITVGRPYISYLWVAALLRSSSWGDAGWKRIFFRDISLPF